MPKKKPMSARKTKPESQKRTIVSKIVVARTDANSPFPMSRFDDLVSRNDGFEIGCGDFETGVDFSEIEELIDKIFLPEYGGSE